MRAAAPVASSCPGGHFSHEATKNTKSGGRVCLPFLVIRDFAILKSHATPPTSAHATPPTLAEFPEAGGVHENLKIL